MNLARLLLEGFRWFDDALRSRLTEKGLGNLTTAESMVFPYLDREGTRPVELARRLGITRQSAQTLIRGLRAQGLVDLVADPDDGRSKLVVLSDKGRRSVPIAQGIFLDLEDELRGRIGSERVAELRAALSSDWGDSPG